MDKLTGSEALFGFMGWLTSRDEVSTFSARHEASSAAQLVDEFCKVNNLAPPREFWHENLIHPVSHPTPLAVVLGAPSNPSDSAETPNH